MAVALGVLIVVVWLTSGVVQFVIKHRARITCMTGMMAAMTVGMMAGLAVGAALGFFYRQDLFTSSLMAMVIGIAAGVATGLPIGTMAVMDGLMAGLMGGMMGAMLGQMLSLNHPVIMAGIMLAAFAIVVRLLHRLLQEETGTREFKQPTEEGIARPLNRLTMGAAASAAVVLIGTMFLRPGLPAPSGLARAAEISDAGNPAAAAVASINSTAGAPAPQASGPVQVATIQVGLGEYTPDHLVLKKGLPVRLNLVKNYNGGCQSTFVIPDLGVQKYVTKGTTAVEFTPTREGQLAFSCGMGMFGGSFTVVA